MARTNKPAVPWAGNPLRSSLHTHEGAVARRITPEQELRRSVMSCMLWERSFYENGEDVAVRIDRLAQAVPQETVARLAIEAREEMHLRHVPLWLVCAMAPRGGRIVGDTLARVIQRADELTEFVALYWRGGKRPLSAQVKRGLATAFTKFDAYQLAKYDRENAVRLRDVMFLTHPKPLNDEQAQTWKQLVDGTLPVPDTWEVSLSAGGDKRAHWTRLLEENKLGGLALLRNLRNMQEAGVDDGLLRDTILTHRFARVLPFRFIAAARYAPDLEPELERAMLSAPWIDMEARLPGKTLLLVDHSGSMTQRLSERSDMTRFDAAAGLAVILREICNRVDIVAFSAPIEGFYRSHYGGYTVPFGGRQIPLGEDRPAVAVVPPRRGFALRDALEQATPWWGTNTEDGKQFADSRGYDRIVLITDEQSHQTISAPKGRGYVINVSTERNGIGYGAWTHVDGWSESVVRYIAALETLGLEMED